MSDLWLNKISWSEEGLVPVIAQDANTGSVLMMAWMNLEAVKRTIQSGEAIYWSRSRKKLWHKGEESGNIQRVQEIRLDCDGDAILIKVEQVGGIACHTGRAHCFYNRLEKNRWVEIDPVLRSPDEMYQKKS